MSKALILFYSFEGSTRKIAEFISSELNVPCEEIKPVKDLKSKVFSKYIMGGGQVIMGAKPELMPLKSNLDDYDTILLGSPVWAGNITPAIKSILESGILKNKRIAYFCCHRGSSGKSEAKAREATDIYNEFVSFIELSGVKDNYESLKLDALNWAKTIV